MAAEGEEEEVMGRFREAGVLGRPEAEGGGGWTGRGQGSPYDLNFFFHYIRL